MREGSSRASGALGLYLEGGFLLRGVEGKETDVYALMLLSSYVPMLCFRGHRLITYVSSAQPRSSITYISRCASRSDQNLKRFKPKTFPA
jgi:hypothetical protein